MIRRPQPIAPKNGPDTKIEAPSLDVSAFAENAPSPAYNGNVAAVYPMGVALSPDGETLYTANDLADSLGIVSDLRGSRKITRHRRFEPLVHRSFSILMT